MTKAQMISKLLTISEFLIRSEGLIPFALRYGIELKEIAHALADEVK